MSTRKLVAEWWEIWWCKPGEPSVRVNASEWPEFEYRPKGSFSTRAAARKYKRRWKNKYHKIRHVTRWHINKHGIRV